MAGGRRSGFGERAVLRAQHTLVRVDGLGSDGKSLKAALRALVAGARWRKSRWLDSRTYVKDIVRVSRENGGGSMLVRACGDTAVSVDRKVGTRPC